LRQQPTQTNFNHGIQEVAATVATALAMMAMMTMMTTTMAVAVAIQRRQA
jgi:hypothetical protein